MISLDSHHRSGDLGRPHSLLAGVVVGGGAESVRRVSNSADASPGAPSRARVSPVITRITSSSSIKILTTYVYINKLKDVKKEITKLLI